MDVTKLEFYTAIFKIKKINEDGKDNSFIFIVQTGRDLIMPSRLVSNLR